MKTLLLTLLCVSLLSADYATVVPDVKNYPINADQAYSIGTVTSGNCLIVMVAWSGAGGDMGTIVDALGFTWTDDGVINHAGGLAAGMHVWHTKATASGADTVTFSQTVPPTADRGFIKKELSGMGNCVLDVKSTTNNGASTTTPTSNSITTTTNGYLIAFWNDETQNPGTEALGNIAGAAAADIFGNTTHWDASEDNASSGPGVAAGTYTASFVMQNASASWNMWFGAFKVPATGGSRRKIITVN